MTSSPSFLGPTPLSTTGSEVFVFQRHVGPKRTRRTLLCSAGAAFRLPLGESGRMAGFSHMLPFAEMNTYYFPLLILMGSYHYRTYFHCSRKLKQMDVWVRHPLYPHGGIYAFFWQWKGRLLRRKGSLTWVPFLSG